MAGRGQGKGVGAGSKGQRQYDGQGRIRRCRLDTAWGRYQLFRRSSTALTAWQAYGIFAPQACDLATRAAVAGTREHIESAFAMAKQQLC